MNPNLHEDALHIVTSAIDAVKPDAAVRRACKVRPFPGVCFWLRSARPGCRWHTPHCNVCLRRRRRELL